MLLGPLLQHRDLTMIDRQPDMNIKLLSAMTALARHINVDAGTALRPYVDTLAAQVIVSTSQKTSLGQSSILCSGQLDLLLLVSAYDPSVSY
jgi:ubiquinone biosynthesis protein UbiJ